MRALIIIFLSLPGIFLVSCKKASSNSNPTPSNPTYFFKAKINGTMYEGSSSLANHMLGDAVIGSTITFNGQQMAFTVFADSYTGVKTYGDSISRIILGNTDPNGYSDFFNGSSMVNIISDGGASGTVLKGEFSGTLHKASDSSQFVTITEGTFEAKWTN